MGSLVKLLLISLLVISLLGGYASRKIQASDQEMIAAQLHGRATTAINANREWWRTIQKVCGILLITLLMLGTYLFH